MQKDLRCPVTSPAGQPTPGQEEIPRAADYRFTLSFCGYYHTVDRVRQPYAIECNKSLSVLTVGSNGTESALWEAKDEILGEWSARLT